MAYANVTADEAWPCRASGGPVSFLLYSSGRSCRYELDGGAMKQVHVIVTWQSEHVVEIDEEDGLDNLAELLQAQSNVKLVSYTARPLDQGRR